MKLLRPRALPLSSICIIVAAALLASGCSGPIQIRAQVGRKAKELRKDFGEPVAEFELEGGWRIVRYVGPVREEGGVLVYHGLGGVSVEKEQPASQMPHEHVTDVTYIRTLTFAVSPGGEVVLWYIKSPTGDQYGPHTDQNRKILELMREADRARLEHDQETTEQTAPR